MLAIEPFRPGTKVYYWAVEDIMRHPSCDMDVAYCARCETYLGWGEACEHMSRDEVKQDLWEWLLEGKREDEQYEILIESIRKNGFVRPIHADIDYADKTLHFGNGHHRLAAAMELGYTTVPVVVNHGGTWALDELDGWQDAYDYDYRMPEVIHQLDGVEDHVMKWSQPRELVNA